ncbi:hypothetical protein JW899_04365 [Candidatus Uhrbacteria bacterium]|nr:hypothetical protein [Candidatus Uhrbacteria bacterium]
MEEAKEMEKMERSISKKIDDAAESGPIAILKNVAEGIDEIREGILSSENRPGGMLDITVHAYTEEFGHFKLQMTTV